MDVEMVKMKNRKFKELLKTKRKYKRIKEKMKLCSSLEVKQEVLDKCSGITSFVIQVQNCSATKEEILMHTSLIIDKNKLRKMLKDEIINEGRKYGIIFSDFTEEELMEMRIEWAEE